MRLELLEAPLATQHEGPHVTAMRRRDAQTGVTAQLDRVRDNDEIREHNRPILQRNAERIARDQEILDLWAQLERLGDRPGDRAAMAATLQARIEALPATARTLFAGEINRLSEITTLAEERRAHEVMQAERTESPAPHSDVPIAQAGLLDAAAPHMEAAARRADGVGDVVLGAEVDPGAATGDEAEVAAGEETALARLAALGPRLSEGARRLAIDMIARRIDAKQMRARFDALAPLERQALLRLLRPQYQAILAEAERQTQARAAARQRAGRDVRGPER
jgi:hypothetical protein